MITLTDLTKQYPAAARPAVDRVTLTVPGGEICVLIGPSGCGKTTTMRLINRMIEPTGGRIELAGRDVTHIDAVELRRGIGYASATTAIPFEDLVLRVLRDGVMLR